MMMRIKSKIKSYPLLKSVTLNSPNKWIVKDQLKLILSQLENLLQIHNQGFLSLMKEEDH